MFLFASLIICQEASWIYIHTDRVVDCGIVAIDNVVSIVIKYYFQILIIKFKKKRKEKYHFQISGSNKYGRWAESLTLERW